MTLIESIQQHAASKPSQVALQTETTAISYQQFWAEIKHAQSLLNEYIEGATIALAMDNHPAWATLDIAANASYVPLVPIPAFFSDTQIIHAVTDAGASVFITDTPQRFTTIFDQLIQKKTTIMVAGKRLMLIHLDIAPKILPKDTAKITYTSGTTGQPKGVCLSSQAMLSVASSIKK